MSAQAVELCEGCGKPLVGKRRGAHAHNSTCRWRKKRRLEREAREPEWCSECAHPCDRLDPVTGWCVRCTRSERQAAA